MDIKITPHALSGRLRAIASKSDAHRVLICAALCDGAGDAFDALCARFVGGEAGFDPSEDILATIACLRALKSGAQIPTLDCGESGSTLRFLLPVAMAVADTAAFDGHGRLPQRPLGELKREMEAHGCKFSAPCLPFTVCGRLTGGTYTLPGNVSSQYVTGLLLALPMLGSDSRIVLTSKLQSAAYVEMTLRTLRAFGIRVCETADGYEIPGNQHYTWPRKLAVEGDWSNAAFFLTAGMLGNPVTVTDLVPDSPQADRAIAVLLAGFGADCKNVGGDYTVAPAAVGKPMRIDVSECPDLFPILSVAAAGVCGETVLENAARLRLKESDRIQTTAQMLQALGGNVSEREDALVICGTGKLCGGCVDSCGDHRIAMAAAIASILCEEPVVISHAEAVRKSYPRFFEDFRQLGGIADVIGTGK
ncbi:MAG: 3-phosphoshikimate 1-carboxyvinyltransferase [Clostridia bacterium]|nr:3-phosphoshikimate 1-carboxyvinyltransferase [Clostridia bacterium]